MMDLVKSKATDFVGSLPDSLLGLAFQSNVPNIAPRKAMIMEELLGPLLTPALHSRLNSCRTLEDMYPTAPATPGSSHPSSELEAAELFCFPTTAGSGAAKRLAFMADLRLMYGARLSAVGGGDSRPSPVVWKYEQPQMDSLYMEWMKEARPAALPDPIPAMLAAARVLQQSSALAAAGELPYNALLVSSLQRNLASHISHCITAGDIYSLPRNELPALWAALAAADACVTLMWSGARGKLEVASTQLPGHPVWLQTPMVSRYSAALQCCTFLHSHVE
jgi:hypothetical protein